MSEITGTFKAGTGIIINPGKIDTTTSESFLTTGSLQVLREYFDKRIADLAKNPLYQHKCISCGGTVELDYDKAIFICPYCGSHYALNTERINDRG